MTSQLRAGDTHYANPCCVVDAGGAALTGLTTLLLAIRRNSDGAYWDFGGTPQFRTSAWTTRLTTLAEVSASLSPGYYRHAAGWDTTGLAAGLYIFEFTDSGGTAANMPQTDDAQIQLFAITADVTTALATILAAIPSAATNATTLLDQALSGHTTAGTAGKALSNVDVASSTLATAAALTAAKTAIDAANTTLAAIQGGSWSGTTDTLHALRAAVDAAQADLTAIKGVGFTGGADDMHSTRTLLATKAAPGDAMDLIATAIKSTTIASAALTAAAFATNSITANAVATDAVAEIQAGLALDATVAKPGDQMGLVSNAITSAKIATNAITANGLASDAVAEITAGLAVTSDVTASTAATASAITAATSPLATAINLAAVKTAVDAANAALTAIEGGSFSGTTDSLHALQVSLTAARADLTAAMGVGFTPGLDDLHHAFQYLNSLDQSTAQIKSVLGIYNIFTVGASPAPTSTVFATNCTDPDGSYVNKTLVYAPGSSVSSSARVVSFVGGVFTVSPPLLNIPDVADDIIVLNIPFGATVADVLAAAAAVVVAPNGIGTTSVATDALNAAAFAAAAVSKIQNGLATAINVTDARDHVEAFGQSHWVTADISTLATAVAAVPAAVWTMQLPGGFATGSAGKLVATAGALVVPDAPTVAAAVWAASTSLTTINTYGWALSLMPEWILGKQTLTAGNPGKLRFYSRGNVLLYTYDLTDYLSQAVTATAGAPFNRSAGT